jgi:capsular exopolysaccharide synthesis family protein
MTTLPQTTPIRLPRPGGTSQLSVPTGSVNAPAQAGPGFQMTGGDVWRVIRANMWLIILFVLLSATAGYFINNYLEIHYSAWTANGWIRILSAPEPSDSVHGSQMPEGNTLIILQSTEVQLLKSERLLDNILKEADNPIRSTNWWKVTCGGDPQKAHQLFAKNLVVNALPDSTLIKVSVTSTDQSDTPVLVSALVERAIQDEKGRIRDETDADYKRINELKTRYEMLDRNKSLVLKDEAEELSRLGGDTRGIITSKDVELSKQLERQLQLQTEKLTTDNALASFREKKDHGETPTRVYEMVEQDRDVLEYKNSVNGANNPSSKQLQAQLTSYQNKLDDVRAQKTQQYMNSMESELVMQQQTVNQSLDDVNDRVSHLKADIADLSNKYNTYLIDREEETNDREFVKQYAKELQDLDQMIREQQYGTLAWAEKPLEPDVRSFPNLSTTMSSAVVIGLFLSLGIAFLREVTDTTVRSPRDIARVGQMNLLGMVPHEADDPQSSGARLPLVIFEAPHSMMAEQLRQVRTRLQHAASLDTTRSILVTSPGPGDGKSTIAVNLAAGLALNGRRILLVDANFRRPELHRIFGIGNEAGFSDVLNDVNAFSSTIRETSVPNLSVMASGPKPSNPTELLESQLLLDFIERALEEYDHVIFDSGPMLFVSESVALAPRVDGVVTVVKARTSSRGVLQRMRDGLRAVKAEHLGVVLNGVRSQAGGYYGRSIKTYYEYQSVD